MPERVQRKRTAGWTMPENAIYVGRPTRWGNPYKVGYYTLQEAVTKYECWLAEMVAKDPKFLEPLRGKDLACWCPPWSLCHVDILLREANKCSKCKHAECHGDCFMCTGCIGNQEMC